MALNRIILHNTALYHAALYNLALSHAGLYRTAMYHIALHHTILYHTTLYYITRHHTTLYHIALYNIALYHTALLWKNCNTSLLYHTIPAPTPKCTIPPIWILWDWLDWRYHVTMSPSPTVTSPEHILIPLLLRYDIYLAALGQCSFIRFRSPFHYVHEKDYFKEIVKEDSS